MTDQQALIMRVEAAVERGNIDGDGEAIVRLVPSELISIAHQAALDCGYVAVAEPDGLGTMTLRLRRMNRRCGAR